MIPTVIFSHLFPPEGVMAEAERTWMPYEAQKT
jgi:hypothetical protein